MGIYNVRCEHGIMATDCLICSTCSSCAEKEAEIERLTGVIALDCKIMEESSDKLKAAEQKIVEKDMEISKLKEGILLLREQLTNPRR